MMPMIFIADGRQCNLIDAAAIGMAANPFAGRMSAWNELELGDFIRDVDSSQWCGWQEIKSGGPENQAGFLIRVLPKGSSEDAAPMIGPDTTWARASDRVWISTDTPHPSDLIRYSSLAIPTHSAILGDGQVWEIPRIRRTMESGYLQPLDMQRSELPHRVRRNWEGGFEFDPLPQWSKLWQQSLKMAQAQLGEPVSVSWAELLEFAIEVLSIRYRFPDLMARVFPDVLTSESLWRVAKAACGFDLIEAEIQKKRTEPEDTAA